MLQCTTPLFRWNQRGGKMIVMNTGAYATEFTVEG
jgi:hypothetical protein